MTDHNDNEIRHALKQAFPPIDDRLNRDLWPLVLRNLDNRSTRVPWYDWALIAVTILTVLAFPQLMLVFAYHL